jgi:hypothetical protein
MGHRTGTYFLELLFRMISGFRHEVDETCALLGYYAARSGNFLPTFWNNLPVPSSGMKGEFLSSEDATDRLSRNVGKKLPLLAA